MLEEVPLHEGVGVYEHDRISARCGDAPVVGARDASLRSLRTSASESFFIFCISARFPSMSGRWRHAPAKPSRCAPKEPVAAAVIRRTSCPAAKKGSICGTAERGRFLTSRLRVLRLPSLVAVGLRLPPVEALPMW